MTARGVRARVLHDQRAPGRNKVHLVRVLVGLCSLPLCYLLWPTPALAGDDVLVVVHQDDDLEELVTRLTGDQRSLTPILESNGFTRREAVPPGAVLRIPADRLVALQHSHAELLFVRAPLEITSADGRSLPVGVGARLVAGDVLQTGPGGAANLRLVGYEQSLEHDHLFVTADSKVEIGQILTVRGGSERHVLLRLLQGAIEVVTSHSGETRLSIEVETPTAIGGVRGTSFRTVVEEGAEQVTSRWETLDGAVATAAAGDEVTVPARFGTRVEQGGAFAGLHPLPPPPHLDRPLDGVAIEEFTFGWQPVPAAAAYVLEIAEDPGFHRRFLVAAVDEPMYAPTVASLPVRDEPYFWRVSTIDGDGYQGWCSPARSFAVSIP